MKRIRIAVVAAALAVLVVPAAANAATPNEQATCVGLASAFFGQQGVRNDVSACHRGEVRRSAGR